MNNARHIQDFTALKGYDEICLTGGEPMLNPLRTCLIVEHLCIEMPNTPIYLYTAQFDSKIERILPLIQGVHFTLHTDASSKDVEDFILFQQLIEQYQANKSYRLYISPDVNQLIPIKPFLWARIEVKPWIPESECYLPVHETLFILENFN